MHKSEIIKDHTLSPNQKYLVGLIIDYSESMYDLIVECLIHPGEIVGDDAEALKHDLLALKGFAEEIKNA